MSDPQPARLKPKPRRADPVQPDKPGSGETAGTDAPVDKAAEADGSTVKKNAAQSKAALDNVRKGYK